MHTYLYSVVCWISQYPSRTTTLAQIRNKPYARICQLYLPEYKPRNQYLKANQFVVRIVDFIFLLLLEHSSVCLPDRLFVRSFGRSFTRLFGFFFPQFPSFTPFFCAPFRPFYSIFPSDRLTLFTLYSHKIFSFTVVCICGFTKQTSFCVSRCCGCDSTVRYTTRLHMPVHTHIRKVVYMWLYLYIYQFIVVSLHMHCIPLFYILAGHCLFWCYKYSYTSAHTDTLTYTKN